MTAIFKYVLTTFVGFVLLTSVYLFITKKYYKKGQEEEKQRQVNDNVKEALDIKKEIYSNYDTSIYAIRERMHKYTRD